MFSVMLFCVTKNSILFALYEFDTGAFVSLFCENKGRPQLNCNGHCKLVQMAKEQDKKDASDSLNNLQQEIFLYYQEPAQVLQDGSGYAGTITTYTRLLSDNYFFLYCCSNDKPPRFLS